MTASKEELLSLASRVEALDGRNRLSNGRFAPRFCGDPNCSGELVPDAGWRGEAILRCDGLTHQTDDGPLIACMVQMPALAHAQEVRG